MGTTVLQGADLEEARNEPKIESTVSEIFGRWAMPAGQVHYEKKSSKSLCFGLLQWNLDLRKILGVIKIFLKSRFFLFQTQRKTLKKQIFAKWTSETVQMSYCSIIVKCFWLNLQIFSSLNQSYIHQVL